MGFDRGIPINPSAAAFEDAAREIIVDNIKLPENLSELEQRMVKIAMARWLENWTVARCVDKKLLFEYRVGGKDLSGNMHDLLSKMTGHLRESFQDLLPSWNPERSFESIERLVEEKAVDLTSHPQEGSRTEAAPLRAIAVEEKDSLFRANPFNSSDPSHPEPFPSMEEVRSHLESVGIGAPILSWDVATLWMEYSTRLGMSVPSPCAQISPTVASAPINPDYTVL